MIFSKVPQVHIGNPLIPKQMTQRHYKTHYWSQLLGLILNDSKWYPPNSTYRHSPAVGPLKTTSLTNEFPHLGSVTKCGVCAGQAFAIRKPGGAPKMAGTGASAAITHRQTRYVNSRLAEFNARRLRGQNMPNLWVVNFRKTLLQVTTSLT